MVAAVEHAVVAEAAELGIEAQSGEQVLYFSQYSSSPGFGESRIDRCVTIEPSKALRFSYWVYADVDAVGDELRVRVNPNFYEDLATCEGDVAAGVNDNRLNDNWANLDWDVRLFTAGVRPNTWFHAVEATHGDEPGTMEIPAAEYPELARVVRFSLRMRDDDAALDPSRRLVIDSVRLWHTAD